MHLYSHLWLAKPVAHRLRTVPLGTQYLGPEAAFPAEDILLVAKHRGSSSRDRKKTETTLSLHRQAYPKRLNVAKKQGEEQIPSDR